MPIPHQIATHFRQLFFGGNWTSVNMKDTLANVHWKKATTQVHSFNTIAALVFHTNYYVDVVIKVLHGEPLYAHDKFSFDLPPISSDEDWNKLLNKTWADAETFAALIEQLAESKLWETFMEGKYGNYYRNLHGIIEHTHYHLGQIVLIKKLVAEMNTAQSD